MKRLWVVGEIEPDGDWSLVGVFSQRELALAACESTVTRFMGPVELDQAYFETQDWPELEWPNAPIGRLDEEPEGETE